MTWKGRTGALLCALLLALAALALVVGLAARRSPVVPRGQATEEAVRRMLDELRRDMRDLTKTEEEVRRIIDGLCFNYPELRDAEICREQETSREDQGR